MIKPFIRLFIFISGLGFWYLVPTLYLTFILYSLLYIVRYTVFSSILPTRVIPDLRKKSRLMRKLIITQVLNLDRQWPDVFKRASRWCETINNHQILLNKLHKEV